jgi:tetratricopeptide (TPR) repeat protein
MGFVVGGHVVLPVKLTNRSLGTKPLPFKKRTWTPIAELASAPARAPLAARRGPDDRLSTGLYHVVMGNSVRLRTLLFIACALVMLAYLIGAIRRKEALNLSATAGGQYPYLVYAQGMAREGWWRYFGDRNRMPLYPALLSLVHVDDWEQFVRRSAVFAIVSSMLVLCLISAAARASLAALSTATFTCAAAATVFSRYASFVQAELLYYGLFFLAWLLCGRELRRPTWTGGALTGVVLGFCYLAKASALPLLFVYLTVALARAVIRKRRSYIGTTAGDQPCSPHGMGRSIAPIQIASGVVPSAAMTVLGFLAVCFPYLKSNYDQFGRPFYNVNAAFFMWCDSWSEAEAFATKYAIDREYPAAPPTEVPGPVRYFREHSVNQILERMGQGIRTLGGLVRHEPCTKYVLVLAGWAAFRAVRRRGALRAVVAYDRVRLVFTLLVLGSYGLAYAWYAQVAFGERFVLSLVLPTLFGWLWLIERMRQVGPIPAMGGQGSRESSEANPAEQDEMIEVDDRTGNAVDDRVARHVAKKTPPHPRRHSLCGDDRLLALLLVVLVAESIGRAAVRPTPDPAFTVFYFNESKAREREGDWKEAQRGYRGVLELDPSFDAAHQSLGMIALKQGRAVEALTSLRRAVDLRPDSADAHNSLGSALVQSGDLVGAIAMFEKAVGLDPSMGVAWYNLGGAYGTNGDRENAARALARLGTVDAALARQLAQLMREDTE